MHVAALKMNAYCQEGKYGELGAHHKEFLSAMMTEEFQEKLQNFNGMLEPQQAMFKFANDYIKFVKCILMFLRATREGN